MFEYLKKFNKILVTGPQRSGTRICAKIIAQSVDYVYIDEKYIALDSLYKLFSFLNKKNKMVIQCPGLCRHVHRFSHESTAIILMRRTIKDIIASQNRINWQWEWLELARYDLTEGCIAEVKYRFWEDFQKNRIKNAFEIEFESLASHSLWIPKEIRRQFDSIQTYVKKFDFSENLQLRPNQTPGIQGYLEPEQNTFILVHVNGYAKQLNKTGRLIWSLCDGHRTLYEIVQEIKKHFNYIEVEVLIRDIKYFLKDLYNADFIRL